MGIMNDFLCVRTMTMAAIARLLSVVLEMDALRMTDRTTDARVGCGFIIFKTDERQLPGVSFPVRLSHSVTMEANPLQPFGIVHGDRAVAGHAGLILRGERRQGTLVLVADPALAMSRN